MILNVPQLFEFDLNLVPSNPLHRAIFAKAAPKSCKSNTTYGK